MSPISPPETDSGIVESAAVRVEGSEAGPGPGSGPALVLWGDDAIRAVEGGSLENGPYWRGVLAVGPWTLAENLCTRAGVVVCDGTVWPLTLDDGRVANSYPCSLYTQYVRYPLAELDLVPHGVPRRAARIGLGLLGWVLRRGSIDRLVQWNSWLLSTNLHDPRLPRVARSITRALIDGFPEHAILVKNLFGPGDAATDALVEAGYDLVVSRRVYLFDGRRADYLDKPTVRRDVRASTQSTGYRVVDHADLVAADVPRITNLYRRLYLEKHTNLNPRYTEAFVARALRERWLEFRGVRDPAGELCGVYAAFTQGGWTTTPFIGYDTSLPRELGLYRRLVAALLTQVAERGQLLNYSSGAGEFKRRRGGVPTLEYNAIYTRHLPPGRRAAFALLRQAVNRIGARFLERRNP